MKAEPIPDGPTGPGHSGSVSLRLKLLWAGQVTATRTLGLSADNLTPVEECFHQELGGWRSCSPEVRALERGPL